MAKRPVFRPTSPPLFVRSDLVDFEWFAGFAASQKQRSIRALHEAASVALGVHRPLEVSTKSETRLGALLSAFRLRLTSEHLEHSLTVEAAFQGSKVFVESGQHDEIYRIEDGREIKRIIGGYSEESIEAFVFEGRHWPTEPKTVFYDWLYLRALRQMVRAEEIESGSSESEEQLLRCDGFTDIEFNPQRSFNCQARSCALYVALHRVGSLASVDDPDLYLDLITGGAQPSGEAVQPTLFSD